MKRTAKNDAALMQEAIKVLRAIEINSLFNGYAIEDVAFGVLKFGEKIPFERFMEDLHLEAHKYYSVRNSISGVAIAEDETVKRESSDFFFRECFISNMNILFDAAPQSKKSDVDENGLYPFVKKGLNAYIMRLYPLFRNILETEVEYDFFAFTSPFSDRTAEADCYKKIAKFIVAVLTRGLRQGRCVDRYLKDIPYLPYFLKQILRMRNGRCLLANSDKNSMDFQFAVLSAISFMNTEHTRLFERKAQKYYHLISG